MTISPEFLDELRERVTLAELIGAKVKLRRQGREHIGLCPFHNEKTPSFTVADDKHFYHCFGCGAHGDAIRFIVETEGLNFREAVEKLAARAGLTVPRETPEERERVEKRASLLDIVERVAGWFESQLASEAGAGARKYLDGRGVGGEMRDQFRLGFAPDRRTALKGAMAAREISAERLFEAGLVIKPEDGGESYDRFRGRLIFPISDRRGRVVGFGGRALGEARAKYLNSPETALFSKGRLLYNLAAAREAARGGASVIAVEGYMDVIALVEAGFAGAVAPLGTAVTEHQLGELWRLAAEPVLCFDGDDAGLRAGYRVLERALPLLRPGYSLRVAFLPEGDDPDSLIRRRGAGAFAEVIDTAAPMVEVLWQSQVHDARLDTPERRAGFQSRLDGLVRTIGDHKVRAFYQTEMARRLEHQFGPHGVIGGRQRRRYPSPFSGARVTGIRPETRRKNLGAAARGSPERREQLIVLCVINHPWLLDRHTEDFAGFVIASRQLDKVRDEIIGFAADNKDLDSETLKRHLHDQGFAALIDALGTSGAFEGVRFVVPDAEPAETEKGWRQLTSRHGRVGLEVEVETAEAAFGRDDSEENWGRLVRAKESLEAAAGNEADL